MLYAIQCSHGRVVGRVLSAAREARAETGEPSSAGARRLPAGRADQLQVRALAATPAAGAAAGLHWRAPHACSTHVPHEAGAEEDPQIHSPRKGAGEEGQAHDGAHSSTGA